MATADTPVREGDRLDYLDVLRGFAVLAIFAVNIKGMAAPFAYYMNASLWPGEYDLLVAEIQAFIIDNKWRTNFTALFGAGLVLISMKADAAGAKGTGRILLRNSWLLLFGVIHLLLIWMGDILTVYALTGFVAIWFRNLSGRTLGWCTLGIMIVALAWTSMFGVGPAFVPELGAEVSAIMWGSDPAVLDAETATYLGGVGGHIQNRLHSAFDYLVMYGLVGGQFLLTLSIMLAGMWLFKIGFYKGAWSGGNYLLLAIIGLALAWGLEALHANAMASSGWSFETFSIYTPVATIAGLVGAFGYAALVGFLLKIGLKLRPVAAAGRMAFTNYISCSLIGTTIFYGHAGGLFGQVTNLQLMGIVGVTWLAILIWSPIWLKHFHFGPLEWLWRSLTYWQVQPFRRKARDEAPPERTESAETA
ncbi:DUF418 domain-containing protein [Parvularcula flava]|uniref:DUF418 domain-containing protein n=1 Tax=Aquisalinus luteolus TaxID=1566827 RepID=A0A8J3A4R2_9PROT|nr:DUF418 domain-containing protein [Aquisalinus luteolus]NHK26872.1 DUF418 domain-containing protein [Aquisalinus luteolus]GGH93668.1 hypothetical protein GCM10011355_06050 [Aquisalinus luteolus]